jgi:hypothetical protein
MAGKGDFTETEWQTLEKGVTGTALLVSLADASFFDTFKEVGALTEHLKNAREKSSSQLVRDLAETRATGFGVTASAQEVEMGTIDALRSALATLKAKAPEEAPAYSAFVLEVADSIAKAVSDVAASESGASDKIKGALQSA